MEVLIAPE
jgi:hypothetical protein